jgi:hypothetical protein
MERRNLCDWHVEQVCGEARSLLVIAFNGLGSQFLVNMLAEELLHKHRECLWHQTDNGNPSGQNTRKIEKAAYDGRAV